MERYDSKKLEEEIGNFWKKQGIYEKLKSLGEGKKLYFFIDGPPYASGNIHMGTAWNKILKDCYLRFWRMQGFNVWDQPGYDTHGTPIEVQVEKKLGFTSKKDIENFGVAKFVKKCREFATKYIDVMNDQFYNLGVWMDWGNPYLTLNNSYIEGAWFTFKKAFEKGFLYKGSYPVHTCSRCETVVAYNEIEYKKVRDTSVYIKFPVKGKGDESLVIWTTTPWTIPANVAIMVHPDYKYAFVETPKETLVIAKELAGKLMKKFEIKKFKITKIVKGRDLLGINYEHPLKELVPALQNLKNAHKVVTSSRFVTLDEGTGLVHTAPGHGSEDFYVGKEYKLPVVSPVGIDGNFTSEAGEWLAGKYTKDMNQKITDKLEEKEVLIKTEDITHDYPLCWRCSTPLLFINVPQWFFRVSDIRKKLLSENEKVKWIPKWASDRFRNWLENLGDWPVSRQRYWGIPLPIWECSCGKIEVIGSYEELKEKSGMEKEIDFHRPEIDNVKLKCKCGKCMERVKDVLDVWFDAGVATWASLGYPRNKEIFDEYWPSEFQVEGPDQFRGWWNSQIITSVLTFGKAPFRNILLHGFILDSKGIKMSKSTGNIVSPQEVIDKHGRDVLRFYLLIDPPWDDFYWNWEEVKDTERMFNILWNVYQFILSYAKKPSRHKELKLEDRWIISKVNSLLEKEKNFKEYKMQEMVKTLKEFILNDFSRWYIKLIRDRVSPFYQGGDKLSAQYTLHYVMEILVKAMAPVAPFLAEKIYLELYKERDSVHLCEFPHANRKLIDKKLEMEMEMTKQLVENMNSLRQENKIKLRWPVSEVLIRPKTKSSEMAFKNMERIIKFMGNSKKVTVSRDLKSWTKEFPKAKLMLGEVLKDEALVRDLIRNVQILRKNEGLKVHEKINVSFICSDKKIEALLRKWKGEISRGTGAGKVFVGPEGKKKGRAKGNFVFDGKNIEFNFWK